eukprot:CAMPEP_0172301802 /NCGR_PEP_ID=MMETSP1058-20130122/3628_1 /TAXON_ID=83371 /ORGANISM="Detonula confervacea, Strain CCMP 353" /LENGTH=50 /DNA_ID=CAMNT_0013012067 /DNA_START=240 /DNA_END=388 /DNA_ORIENTATION=+
MPFTSTSFPDFACASFVAASLHLCTMSNTNSPIDNAVGAPFMAASLSLCT